MKSKDQHLLEEAYIKVTKRVHETGMYFAEAKESLPSISDEDFKTLYDILDRWSTDIGLVTSQEMATVKQFQSMFEYSGLMHRVLWLTPYEELTLEKIKQIKAKEDVAKYKRLHSEYSWSKSLANVKEFAASFLEGEIDFSEFEDPKIKQLITVFCKQTTTGFDVEMFYKSYNTRFGVTEPPVDAISRSANIREIIAPIDSSFTAKPAVTFEDVEGVINRSGKPLKGAKEYVEPHLRPIVYNVTGQYGKGALWVDLSTGKKYKGKTNTDVVYFAFLNERHPGQWMISKPPFYEYKDFKDFTYQPGDKVLE